MEAPRKRVFVSSKLFSKELREFDSYKSVEFIDIGGNYEVMKQAEIILGDPPILYDHIYELPNLKWFHSTRAGVDKLLKHVKPGRTPPFTFTRFPGLYGPTMLQYVLGSIISCERNFRGMLADQRSHVWNTAWQFVPCRSFHELTVGILGLGDIGIHIAQGCKALGMTVWGLGRNKRLDTPPCIDHYRTTDDLPEVLQSCDYVCSVLPSTPLTRHLLSGSVLENCKGRKTTLISVGRGDVIDEDSLVQAIRRGWLSGGVLDVCEKEPLPADSQLWDMPEVLITPHVSGLAFGEQILPPFMENLALYEAGKPLKHVLDWNQDY